MYNKNRYVLRCLILFSVLSVQSTLAIAGGEDPMDCGKKANAASQSTAGGGYSYTGPATPIHYTNTTMQAQGTYGVVPVDGGDEAKEYYKERREEEFNERFNEEGGCLNGHYYIPWGDEPGHFAMVMPAGKFGLVERQPDGSFKTINKYKFTRGLVNGQLVVEGKSVVLNRSQVKKHFDHIKNEEYKELGTEFVRAEAEGHVIGAGVEALSAAFPPDELVVVPLTEATILVNSTRRAYKIVKYIKKAHKAYEMYESTQKVAHGMKFAKLATEADKLENVGDNSGTDVIKIADINPIEFTNKVNVSDHL